MLTASGEASGEQSQLRMKRAAQDGERRRCCVQRAALLPDEWTNKQAPFVRAS